MSKEKKIKKNKVKKDPRKVALIILIVLVILEIIMIPLLVYAKIVKPLPVIMFLVIPTLLAIGILLLCRNALVDYNRRIEKMKKNL